MPKPRREDAHISFISLYRRFWRGSKWQLFAGPHATGVEGMRADMAASTSGLRAAPGVYEFALTAGRGGGRRIKVYVGETGSMLARHRNQYAQGGDHLRDLMDQALRGGAAIWRRERYLSSKEAAVAWEARWLERFDYAWNAVQNGHKRALALRQQFACLCIPTRVAVVEVPRQYSGSPPPKGSPDKARCASPVKVSAAAGSPARTPQRQRQRQPQFITG